MSLPESVLDVVARIAEVVARYPLWFVVGALVLGLVAPPRVRRIVQVTVRGLLVVAKWTVLVALSFALVVYMLPVGVLALAYHLVGLSVFPDESSGPDARQLSLPFDR